MEDLKQRLQDLEAVACWLSSTSYAPSAPLVSAALARTRARVEGSAPIRANIVSPPTPARPTAHTLGDKIFAAAKVLRDAQAKVIELEGGNASAEDLEAAHRAVEDAEAAGADLNRELGDSMQT